MKLFNANLQGVHTEENNKKISCVNLITLLLNVDTLKLFLWCIWMPVCIWLMYECASVGVFTCTWPSVGKSLFR